MNYCNMKRLIFCTLAMLFSLNISAQQKGNPRTQTVNMNGKTVKLKQYYFVMLTKGKNRETQDNLKADEIMKGHLANITRLAEMGKILVTGPFGDDGNWRGIFIFNCDTKEEVEQLLITDPAISSGRLAYEIHPWWSEQNCIFK